MAALRISISGLAFLPFMIIYFSKIDWSKLKYLVIIGLSGSGIPAFLYAFAETEIDSNIAGILNSLTPLFTLVFGILIFKLESNWAKMGGVLLGFVGASVIIIFGQKVDTGSLSHLWYALLIVIATMLYAISVNTVKKYLQEMDPIVITASTLMIISIPCSIYLLATDIFTYVQTTESAYFSLGMIALLSIFGTALSTIIFYKLVQKTNAVFASSVAYFIPVAALFWGMLDNEAISLWHIIGLTLIIIGVYLARK